MKKLITLLFVALMFTVLASFKTNEVKSSSKLCVITKVVLTKMAALNPNGSSWDLGSGPDVFFKIKNQDKTIFESGVASDLDVSTLPVSFTNKLPFTLPYLNNRYEIDFYDYEEGTLLKSDTYIAGFYFNPKDYENQTTIKFSSSSTIFEFTLYLEWE